VMLSDDYVIIKRSTVEKFTNHRHLTIKWTRTKDLVTFDEDEVPHWLREAG
jgi:hypothetical protein